MALQADQSKSPAAQALLRYMEWWSEENYCAGWLGDLEQTMLHAEDEPFLWLVEQAGGWWQWSEGASAVEFQPGTLLELKGG